MTEGISAIGNYSGLNSGLYGSYSPSMMAMMSGYGSYNMTNPMLGSMGMMGMYNPQFMAQQTEMIKQMYSANNEIQKMNLEQQTNMHAAKEQAQVHNAAVHDRAFFETVSVNGDVQNGIREIYDNIRKGNMDYVAKKYFELKQVILNKYSDHFNGSVSGLNDKENIDHYISALYTKIAGGYYPGSPAPDLRQDILTYGETPFEHGMNTTFLGNKNHNKLNAEQCLQQIYGTDINDSGSKQNAEKLGQWAGRAKEGIYAAGLGAVGGGTLWGIKKLFTPTWITRHVPDSIATNGLFKWGGKFGTFVKVGAASLLAFDVFARDTLWQMIR